MCGDACATAQLGRVPWLDVVVSLQAYQIMEVLFNYKRTVQDFAKCGPKSSNPYNFPFVSDCVGSQFRGPCKDPVFPVPCGDGTCQTDYVACLRAMSKKELARSSRHKSHRGPTALKDVLAPAALGLGDGGAPSTAKPKHLRSGEWRFDRTGLVKDEASKSDDESRRASDQQAAGFW